MFEIFSVFFTLNMVFLAYNLYNLFDRLRVKRLLDNCDTEEEFNETLDQLKQKGWKIELINLPKGEKDG